MSVSSETIFLNENVSEKDHKLWCNLCEFVLITSEDIRCSKDFNCCSECWLTFGQSRQKEWKDGWRPDSETLNRYKQSRRIINIDIMKILGE